MSDISDAVCLDDAERRLFPNLDFEQEWASYIRGQQYQQKRVMAVVCERWAHVLHLLDDDAKGPLMWGLTPAIWASLSEEERALVPPLSAVQRVNGKDFSHGLEKALDIALPHACLVSSEAALAAALADCPFDWVLKHPWGVSGRDRVRGPAHQIEERHRRWVQRQLQQGDVLVFEPWMERRYECSLHFDVTFHGEVVEIGTCRLETGTHDGTYRGNLCGPHITAPEGAWEVAREVGRRLAKEGYFGPVGIDMMVGSLGGQPRLRPLMEINARISFGRLALALARYLPDGCSYDWIHRAERDERSDDALDPVSPDGPSDGLFRLPEMIDPGGHSRTLLRLWPGDIPLALLEESR